jgi:hypothetical protein
MNTWKLRDEILSITHRWYWIAACFLIGALIGWAASYLWPSPYRATIDLYVGLNAYRSPYDTYVSAVAQQQFRLVDDYKNWQMEQLNELALTDDFLNETLRRLREHDSSWDSLTPEALRKSLKGVWRNVGKWHLVAEGKDPETLPQALEVWSDVVVEWMSESIEHSKNVVALDVHLNELSKIQVDLELRQEVLRLIYKDLLVWKDEFASLPGDLSVSSQTHWEIQALVALAADWNAGWDAALEAAPARGSLPADYLFWLDRVIPLIGQELDDLPLEIEAVEQKRVETEFLYKEETERSRALAATLEIEKPANIPQQLVLIRPTGLMILTGAFLGLLVWAGWLIARFGREGNQ